MAYSNGFQTVIQSMNGTLSFNDGSGTIIENGTITTQSIALNNIPASLPTLIVNLWSNFTSGTANLLTGLTSGTINFGNSTVSIVVGAITFVGNSIQTGLPLTTLNLFSDFNGPNVNFLTGFLSGTINICTSLTSGTLNIGSGSNINIGSASTGMSLNLDGNGLNNQVFISPQAGATGTVKIGSNDNSNQIGSLFVKNNVISSSSGTQTLSGIQNLAFSTVGKTNPSSITVNTPASGGLFSAQQDFICGGTTARTYDVRQIVTTNGAQAGNGRGVLETLCGSSELTFGAGATVPQNNPTLKTLELGYTTTGQDATFLNAGGNYGGISLGGCGSSNPVHNTTYQVAMTVYPYYGTRLFTGGISFDKGNLTSSYGSGRGAFIQSGTFTQTLSIAAFSSRNHIVVFPNLFGNVPNVTIGAIGPVGRGINSAFHYTITNILVGSFTILVNNNTSIASFAGTIYGVEYIAVGSYTTAIA